MTTRSRVRSARSAKPPSITELTPAEDAHGQDGAQTATTCDGAFDAASESLPDVKLQGKPVPVIGREARIERAAYRRAEGRGFHPGAELDDWLAAEREVDAEAFGENVRRG